MVGEALQPARHGGDGDEGRRGEEQREDQREDHDLGRLHVGCGQADVGEPPAQRVGEEQDQQHAAHEQRDVGADAEAHGVADGRDQHDHEDVADHVRSGAPGQHLARLIGRARNRSIKPLCRSSESPAAVLMAPKMTVCTKMPGIRNSM